MKNVQILSNKAKKDQLEEINKMNSVTTKNWETYNIKKECVSLHGGKEIVSIAGAREGKTTWISRFFEDSWNWTGLWIQNAVRKGLLVP